MIPAPFEYVRATSLPHAFDLMADADGEGAKIIAGGHTLLPALKLRLAAPSRLVDIGHLPELKGIHVERGCVTIEAVTTHAELQKSDALARTLPIFRAAAVQIADPQVRHRGTIGGSLANGDPAADWPAVMIALGAELKIAGPKGTRSVGAEDFFLDIYTTALAEDEILTAISIPEKPADAQMNYFKFRHPASGFAVVGAAVVISLKDGIVRSAKIGITGAASHAFAPKDVETYLAGRLLTAALIGEAAKAVADGTECLSDHYASSEYRRALVEAAVRRCLLPMQPR